MKLEGSEMKTHSGTNANDSRYEDREEKRVRASRRICSCAAGGEGLCGAKRNAPLKMRDSFFSTQPAKLSLVESAMIG